MCDLEYDDDLIFWSETIRRARRAHTCSGCGGSIRPGDRYLVHCSKSDGVLYPAKLCPLCLAARSEFSAAHEGVLPYPAGFEEVLDMCIIEGGEEERTAWGPMLEALRTRRAASRGSDVPA